MNTLLSILLICICISYAIGAYVLYAFEYIVLDDISSCTNETAKTYLRWIIHDILLLQATVFFTLGFIYAIYISTCKDKISINMSNNMKNILCGFMIFFSALTFIGNAIGFAYSCGSNLIYTTIILQMIISLIIILTGTLSILYA